MAASVTRAPSESRYTASRKGPLLISVFIVGVLWTLQSPCQAAPAGAPDNGEAAANTVSTIPLKIRIPDSADVVTTEIAANTTIPDCLRRDPSTIEENGGYTVMAEVFTECARAELRRIQDEYDGQPIIGSTTAPQGKSDETVDAQNPVSGQSDAEYASQDPGSSASAKGTTGLIANPALQAAAGSGSSDMNLKEYLTQASHTAKKFPTAFTLVNVMETLRDVAQKIGEGSPEPGATPPPSQRALLSQVDALLRNPLGEVFNLGPYGRSSQTAGQGRLPLLNKVLEIPERISPFSSRSIFHRGHFQLGIPGIGNGRQ